MLPHITKLYKHGKALIKRVTITSTRYHARYRTFSLILTWTGHNATCYHAYAEVSYMLLNVAAYWHRSNTEACAKIPFSDTCKQH